MRIATVPYNFQSSNFEHVNKHYLDFNYTQNNIHIYPASKTYNSSDNSSYESDKHGGQGEVGVSGDVYATEMGIGFNFSRVGTYEAYGVTRIGPELVGDDQFLLKDVEFKNDGLTGTWLGDVIGLMYKYSASGSYNRDYAGLIKKIGICYLNPSNRKIVTYTAKHLITGLGFDSRPIDSGRAYDTAVMLDTAAKNDVIDRKLKYTGIVVEHHYRHVTGSHTTQGGIWNLRPIIVNDKRDWNHVRDGFTVNGNASGKKIVVPHNNTTWTEYNSGSFRIKTY